MRFSDSPLLLVEKERANRITSSLNVAENVSAPVAEGRSRELVVTDGEEVLLSVDLVASGAVGRMRWADVFVICLKTMFCAEVKGRALSREAPGQQAAEVSRFGSRRPLDCTVLFYI